MFLFRSSPREEGGLADTTSCAFVKDQQTHIFQSQCEEEEPVLMNGSKLTNFLRGWFSYRKFRNSNV